MFDLNGKLVVEASVNADQKQVIDVQNLASGVYTVKASNNKFVKMQKVVITK
jgi:allantoicase